MLSEPKKFTIQDFERMQYDVVSLPAQRLQAIVKKTRPERHADLVDEFLKWDARMTIDSRPALVFELWSAALPASVYPPEWKGRTNLELMLRMLEEKPSRHALDESLDRAIAEIEKNLPNRADWKWGAVHTMAWRHPLNVKSLNLPADAAGGRREYGACVERDDGDERRVVSRDSGRSGLGPVDDDECAGRIGRSGEQALPRPGGRLGRGALSSDAVHAQSGGSGDGRADRFRTTTDTMKGCRTSTA